MKKFFLAAATLAALAPMQAHAGPTITFSMTVSAGAKSCLPNATAYVIDHEYGYFDNLEVLISGLPPNVDFDLFSIEVPNTPFGVGWYIGDINTNKDGVGVGNFVGRFSVETFIVSPNVPTSPPPNAFPSPPALVPEATVGIKTNPIQMYHLGLWFNSPTDAAAAGCASTETPFNGEHNAGIQVLNTATYPDGSGPLSNLP